MIALPVSTGALLPAVGFGFWKVEKANAAEVAQQAIAAGYRHLDCACDYGNEFEVGHGIAQAIETGLLKVNSIVEKPKPVDAPSTLAVVGRYVLTPKIFVMCIIK